MLMYKISFARKVLILYNGVQNSYLLVKAAKCGINKNILITVTHNYFTFLLGVTRDLKKIKNKILLTRDSNSVYRLTDPVIKLIVLLEISNLSLKMITGCIMKLFELNKRNKLSFSKQLSLYKTIIYTQ